MNEGIPVQTVSKNWKSILIPSIYGFKNMKDMEKLPLLVEGAMNSFVEMKLHASKKRING